MSLLRAFYSGAFPEPGGEVTLDPAESRHLTRVRRVRPGDRVQLLDGFGGVVSGTLVGETAGFARVRCQTLARHPHPVPRILAVGLPKGSLFEDIIRQATELGATGVQPLLAARAEPRLDDPHRLAHKQDRWRAAALEACKQSGNPWLPEIHPPLTLEAWLAATVRPGANWQKFVAALTPGAHSITELIALGRLGPAAHATGLLLAVGPEGDFTPEEYSRLAGAGFQPMRLPGGVLRVETACAAALALLGAHSEDF
jgi:16S rRNA (uracil1498-N3)-methyltransferase